jgi:tRNA threonylcarbamoyladenosine biosynthesis protein TsaB
MKLLALDSSASACSVAIMQDDEIAMQHQVAPMQQAQLILPMIDEIMQQSNVSFDQLDALAFGCGPGSFTGVRIAASVIQGLAYATELPIIKISSLAATAQAAFTDLGWKKLLVAMDARISEIYFGAYAVNARGLVELMGEESISAPDKIIFPAGDNWYGVGNAWEVYHIAYQPSRIDASRLPMASAIATLAKEKFQNKEWTALEDAIPAYLRNNVAEKSRK